MKYVAYGLVLLPLLAFFFAITRMMTAKRLSEGMTIKRDGGVQTRNKFMTVCGFVFANVMYGVVEIFLLYSTNGGLNVPENLKYVCVIAFMCNALTCIIQGIIGEKQINKGALTDDSAFTKLILYYGFAEILAVGGMVYFFLGIAGVV